MDKFKEGQVVIVATGQAGTIWTLGGAPAVFLANGDIWYGPENQMRYPQDDEDLKAAVKEFDRFYNRPKPISRKQ